MTALVHAELVRLRTVRSPLLIALGALALMLVMTVAPLLDARADGMAPGEVDELLRSLPVLAVMLVATFAGARTGGDLNGGATTLSYLAEPRRGRVTAARVVTYALLGALFGGVAAALTAGAGLAVADARGLESGLSGGEVLGMVAAAEVAGLLLGAAGALLGTATRNATVASMAIVVWNLAEGLLDLADVGAYLPFGLVEALLGVTDAVDPLVAAGLLAAVVAAGAAAVARWALPRDLT